jgi:hypothetical protein
MSAELNSKRLGLLHEIAPAASRATFLIDPSLTPGIAKRFADAEAVARTLGIALGAAAGRVAWKMNRTRRCATTFDAMCEGPL